MFNIPKTINQFHLIFVIFSIFFSIILFFSAPSLFDYKKQHQNIKNEIESEFNLAIDEISNVKYGFLPTPHLLIEQSKLKLLKDDDLKISDLNNTKLYISLFKLYNNKQIRIKKIEFKNDNFYFNNKNFKSLINHFYEKKTRPIVLKNSNFFYVDRKNDVVTISPIKKFIYKLNQDTNQKKIKISGNLFDSNYNFNWNKDLSKNTNDIEFNLKFKDPNILFENFSSKKNNNVKGKLKTKFLNHTIEVKYVIDDKKIKIISSGNKQNKFLLDGKIELNPFYFDIKTSLKKQNINTFIKKVLLNYFNYKENIHKNLNGKLILNLDKINNAYFKSGFFEFEFYDKKIFIESNDVQIRNIGNLQLKNSLFYESNGDIFFVGEVELKVINQDEFYRRFSIPIKNRIKLNSIRFIYETNIDNDFSNISNVIFNNKVNFVFNLDNINNSLKAEFDNYQKFRNIVKEEFSKIN